MLKKGSLYIIQVWILLIGFNLIVSSGYSQLSIPRNYETKVFEEGLQLYENEVYGYASDRFEAFLSIPVEDRSPAWASNHLSALLHKALCNLWLEENQAEHELVTLVRTHKPAPVVYEAAMEVGNARYNKKRYKQAIEYYDLVDLNVVDQDIKAEVAFKRGYCHFVRKEFDLAANYLTQSAAYRTVYYYPSNYYLGMTSFFNKSYTRAAGYFEKVSSSKKYKTSVPYYLTQIYFTEGNYQRVISYGEKQLNTIDVQKSDELKNLIGRSYYELGDEKQALKYFRAYEESEAKFTASDHYQVGYLYYKDGSHDDAIKHLKEIAALDNETGHQANYYLGHSYIKKGNKEAARSAFANVKRMTDNLKLQDEATYNYGLLSAELNHDREAVNALMEIKPGSDYYSISQEALAKLFLKTNDYDNAISILEELDKSNPVLKEAYQKVTFYKGEQLFKRHEHQAALTYINKSLDFAIDPYIHTEAQFTKGLIQHKMKHYGASISSLNAHATLQSNRITESTHLASYIQGYNYLKQKKYGEAKTHLTKTIESIHRNSPTIKSAYIRENVLSDALVRLGDCEFYFNNYDAALQKYNRAYTAQKSGFVYAYFQSGLIYGLNKDPIQKIVILEDLQNKYPASALADDALVEASRTYLQLGKYDEAANPLLKLTKQYKQSELITQAYLTLGLISYNKGATDQAVKFYKSVFNYNPSQNERQDAFQALQEIYVNDLKDPDEYVAFIESISGGKIANSVRDSLNFKTAYASYVNGEYADATQGLGRYILNFPNGNYHIEAHYFRAECAAIEKDYSNAYRDYVYVIDQGPSQYFEKGLRKSALIAYNELKNFEKSYLYFNQLSALNLTAEHRIEALLGAMRSAHRIDKSQETLRLAGMVHNDTDASANDRLAADYYLAIIYYDKKLYDEALAPLNRLSKQSQDEFAAEARYLIASSYYQQEEFGIAEEMCRLAIKENANYPYWVAKSIILLSDVLVAKGDTFNAKAALEAVIENFTEDATLVADAKSKLKRITDAEKRTNELIQDSKNDLIQLEEN